VVISSKAALKDIFLKGARKLDGRSVGLKVH
jgi:hypothetical protein